MADLPEPDRPSRASQTGGGRPRGHHGALAPWQVERVLDHIEANPQANLSLADLAALVSLSPFHFARAFRQSLGLPPRRYQVVRRLERAKAMLCETDLPVAEIAQRLGFTDPSYFARLLRRATGLAPRAFRRAQG